METKVCSKCYTEKSVIEFNKKGNGLQARCRDCCKEELKKHYRANKERYRNKNRRVRTELIEWFQNFKSKLYCVECMESRWWVLEFHHTKEKELNVGAMISRMCSKDKILKEIEKCKCLCANCHRDLHYQKRKK
jgi:hypothetical protein